uniref:Uncharacterized protein n=1 Tax=Parascaris univalens TaxID=6257 RepID=A0A915B9K5_PARUN
MGSFCILKVRLENIPIPEKRLKYESTRYVGLHRHAESPQIHCSGISYSRQTSVYAYFPLLVEDSNTFLYFRVKIQESFR